VPESTLQRAIEELHSIVEALKELLDREFPRRHEVEESFREQERKAIETFVTKKVSKQRWVFLLMLAPLMVVATFFFTIGTVSTCFLGRDAAKPPQVCSVIPGYDHSRERQRDFRDRFLELERKVDQ
jgi:Holliday junction resolvasome RuvABC endonuclease subunit